MEEGRKEGRKDVPYLRIQFTQNLCCDDDDVHNLFERFPGSIPLEHGWGSRAYTTSSTVAKGIIIHHNSKSCSNYLWRCDLERSIIILSLLPWNTECFPCSKERLIVWGVSFLHKAGRQARDNKLSLSSAKWEAKALRVCTCGCIPGYKGDLTNPNSFRTLIWGCKHYMLSPNLVVETCWGEGLERLPEILDAREATSPPSSFEISNEILRPEDVLLL